MRGELLTEPGELGPAPLLGELVELANLELGGGEVLEVGGGEAALEVESVALGDIAGIPIVVVFEESGGEGAWAAEGEGGDGGELRAGESEGAEEGVRVLGGGGVGVGKNGDGEVRRSCGQ